MRLRALFATLLALPLLIAAVPQQHKDIVDIAASNDDFETLVAAVQAAGLVDVLKSDGPFTVFAPTDEAFARLGDNTIRTLLRPENRDQLTAILTYHVVPGDFSAREIGRLDELDTVQGEALSLGSRIDNAELIATDIEASNGRIHVIDRVLMPREMPPQRRASRSHH
ncbi:MAG: fasciclin domain-containing protein [Bacteroidota bacterium]